MLLDDEPRSTRDHRENEIEKFITHKSWREVHILSWGEVKVKAGCRQREWSRT